MMNKAVGVIIGFIFGTFYPSTKLLMLSNSPPPGATNIMRFGAGPNGVMRTLGQYMLGSGATFGYEILLYNPPAEDS